jgi:hypothetical protein
MMMKRGFESGNRRDDLASLCEQLEELNPPLYRYFVLTIGKVVAAEKKSKTTEIDVFFDILRTRLYDGKC